MASTAQGGFGLALMIDVSGTPAALVQVMDITLPEFRKFISEVTGHDSASGYYEAVDSRKRRVMPFRLKLAWDSTAASHGAIVAAFNGTDPVTFSFEDPDGDENISFEAHVEMMQRMSAQEGSWSCDVMLHPTGAPTIA